MKLKSVDLFLSAFPPHSVKIYDPKLLLLSTQMKRMRLFLVLVACLSLTSLSAQFNIKVGYSGSYLDMPVANAMIASYDKKTGFEDKLKGLGIAHGLDIGMRYRFYSLNIEAGILSTNAEAKSVGQSAAGEKIEKRYRTSLFDYHVSLSQHFGSFGFGGGVARQRLRFKDFNQTTGDFGELSMQDNWAAKAFLQFEFPARNISFALRPYYQFSLDNYDLSSVKNNLDVDSDTSFDTLRMFGLSVLFFNGPQPR